jgi:hypothetical protein
VAYDLLDLTSSVQDDLKDPSFSTSRIKRYLNAGQRLIFNTHSFSFCHKSIVGDLTVGEYTYDQQSDHQATIAGSVIDADNTGNRFLLNEETYVPYRNFFDLYPDPNLNTDSMPSAWTEFGDQVYFDCPVDIAYSFTQRYYRIPTDMDGEADVPDVPQAFRELLELYADYRSEKYRGNHDIAATYKQDFEDGLELMTLRYLPATEVGFTTLKNARVRTEL